MPWYTNLLDIQIIQVADMMSHLDITLNLNQWITGDYRSQTWN